MDAIYGPSVVYVKGGLVWWGKIRTMRKLNTNEEII